MRHGFYANTGRFLLKSSDSKAFPVNSTQLLYLIRNGYILLPLVSEIEIAKKEKEDSIQVFLTLVQLMWFVMQVTGRAILHLPITTLELATLGLVFCSLFAYNIRSYKPLDAEDTIVISSKTSMTDILLQGGPNARGPYRQTPLDFIDEQSSSWLTVVQPRLGFRLGPRQRPLPRLTIDKFPVFGTSLEGTAFFVAIVCYACLHFIGWGFHFPTQKERNIWRVLCITMVASAVVFVASKVYQEGHRNGRWRRWFVAIFPKAPVSPHRNSGPYAPAWQYALFVALSTLYTASRIYIVIECFLSLRALPKGAYDSVEWTNLFPHFQWEPAKIVVLLGYLLGGGLSLGSMDDIVRGSARACAELMLYDCGS